MAQERHHLQWENPKQHTDVSAEAKSHPEAVQSPTKNVLLLCGEFQYQQYGQPPEFALLLPPTPSSYKVDFKSCHWKE